MKQFIKKTALVIVGPFVEEDGFTPSLINIGLTAFVVAALLGIHVDPYAATTAGAFAGYYHFNRYLKNKRDMKKMDIDNEEKQDLTNKILDNHADNLQSLSNDIAVIKAQLMNGPVSTTPNQVTGPSGVFNVDPITGVQVAPKIKTKN